MTFEIGDEVYINTAYHPADGRGVYTKYALPLRGRPELLHYVRTDGPNPEKGRVTGRSAGGNGHFLTVTFGKGRCFVLPPELLTKA